MQSLPRRILTFALVALSVWLSPAGAIEPQFHRPLKGEVWARTELYFGTDRPGANVTDAQFRQFVDQYVTPRFPDGLTLLTGYGQFLNSTNLLVKERSKVLILFYPTNLKNANGKIEDIRDLYKNLFQQESVLRADSLTQISF
jgi:Protein of unknown function (DUF3574)